MDEIDKAVFKIPGLEAAETSDFDAPKETVAEEANVVSAVVASAAPETIAPQDIVPKEIVVKKEVDQNFYDELTAISEEILECRSKILEVC